jgi:hypothetical protein
MLSKGEVYRIQGGVEVIIVAVFPKFDCSMIRPLGTQSWHEVRYIHNTGLECPWGQTAE